MPVRDNGGGREFGELLVSGLYSTYLQRCFDTVYTVFSTILKSNVNM